MNLDLRGYKKIRENENSATLEHPLGHQIKIAKRVLSPENQNELSKLKLAGGGMVPRYADGTPDAVPSDEDLQQEADSLPKGSGAQEEQQRAQNDYQPNFPNAQPADQADQADPGDQGNQQQAPQQPTIVINNTPAQQQPQQPPQQSPQGAQQGQVPMPVPNQYSQQSDPYGANAYSNVSKEGLQNVTQGQQGEAQAQGAINQAQAAAMDPGIQAQQQQLNDYQQRTGDLRSEYQNFIQDYQNKHIDPKNVFENMSTGQKISTGIGLFFGGLSAGFSHQGNPAMDFLNKQIDRDMQAQKDNMDQGRNLLSANMQQYGNERDAMAMTEAMQRGIIANQMQEAALKSGNPLLQAKAQQAIGQFELQNNALFGQMAMRQTLQNGPGGQTMGQASIQGGTPQMPQQGAMNQIDPATKIRLMGQVGYLTPAQVDETQKQLQTAENMSKQRDNLFDAADQLSNINTIGNRIMSPIQTPKQVEAMHNW
jgi:hypothetical protein